MTKSGMVAEDIVMVDVHRGWLAMLGGIGLHYRLEASRIYETGKGKIGQSRQ